MQLYGDFKAPAFDTRKDISAALSANVARAEEERKRKRSNVQKFKDAVPHVGLERKRGESYLDLANRQASSFNERLFGGLTRSAIRLGSAIAPDNFTESAQDALTLGASAGVRFVTHLFQDPKKDKRAQELIDTLAPEAGTKAAKHSLYAEADPNSAGGKLGTASKGVVDTAGLFAPQMASQKALEGTTLVAKGLESSNVFARVASRAGIEVASGLFASGADVAQQVGRGNKPEIVKSVGTGAAIDLASGVLGGVTKPFLQKLADVTDSGIVKSTLTGRKAETAADKVRRILSKKGIQATDDAVEKIVGTRSTSKIKEILFDDKIKVLEGNVEASKAIKAIGKNTEPLRTNRIVRGELYELKPAKSELEKLGASTKKEIRATNKDVTRLRNQLEKFKTSIVKQDLKNIIKKSDKQVKEFADTAEFNYGKSLFFGEIPEEIPPLTSRAAMDAFDAGVADSLLKKLDTGTVDDLYESMTQLKKTPYWEGLRTRLSKKNTQIASLYKQLDQIDGKLTVVNARRKKLMLEARSQGADLFKLSDNQEQAISTLEDIARTQTGGDIVSKFEDAPTVDKKLGPVSNITRRAQEGIKNRFSKLASSDSRVARGIAKTAESIVGDISKPEEVQHALRTLKRVAGAANTQAIDTMMRVNKTLENLEPAAKESVTELLSNGKNPSLKQLAKLPEDAQASYWGIRNAIDAYHTTAYLLGDISENTWKQGRGNYFTRVHKIYDIESNVPPEIKKYMTGTGAKVDSSLAKTRKLTKEQAEKVMLNSPELAIGKQARFVEHNRAIKQFLTELNDQGPDIIRDKASKGFVKLSDSEFYGPVAGKFVRKDIMDEIGGFSSDIKIIDTLMDGLSWYEGLGIRQFRKKMLAVYNPGVRIINKHFNTALAFQGGIDSNPIRYERDMNKAFVDLGEKGGRVRAWEKKGLFTSDITMSEFKKQSQKLVNQKGMNPLQWLDYQALKRYTRWDDAAKLAAAERLVKKGFTADQAVSEVSRVFQDSSSVGLLWDISAKLPVIGKPFGRFTGDFLTRIVPNLVVNRPLRAVGAVATLKALQEASSKLSGETPEDRQTRENRVGAGKIPILNISTEFQTPFGAVDIRRFLGVQAIVGPDGQGSGIEEVTPFYSPIAKNLETGSTELSGQGIGSDVLVGPILQQLINRDYRQKPIDDPDHAKYGDYFPLSAGEKLKNRLNAVWKTFTPPPVIDSINLANSFKFEENEKGLMERKKSISGAERTPLQSFARFFGVRVEQFGKEQAKKQRDIANFFKFKRVESDLLKDVDEATKNQYLLRNKPAKDRKGNYVQRDDALYTPQNMIERINNPELFRLEQKVSILQNEMLGKPIDPLFLLPEEHANAVMTAKASILEQGGDDKTEILYKQPWYKSYQAAEDAYYDAKDAYNKKIFGESFKTEKFSDNSPRLTPKLERLSEQYNRLPEGDGTRGGNYSRRVFLEDNPALANYFDRRRQWKNLMRQQYANKLGIKLPMTDGYNDTSRFGKFGYK